jgi:hypothetical protein
MPLSKDCLKVHKSRASPFLFYKEGKEMWVEVINDQSHLEKGKDL